MVAVVAALVIDVPIEDAMGLEIPGDTEEKDHYAGGPAEKLDRQGGHQSGLVAAIVASLCRFAEEKAAKDGNARGQHEENHPIVDAAIVGRGGGQECSMKRGIKRENGKEESDRFGDIQEHAAILVQASVLLNRIQKVYKLRFEVSDFPVAYS